MTPEIWGIALDRFEEAHRVLSVRQVVEITSLSKTTIWRLGQRNLFPRPFRLSAGRVGWAERDVLAWLAAKAQQSRD